MVRENCEPESALRHDLQVASMSGAGGPAVCRSQDAVQRTKMPADPHLLASGFFSELWNPHALAALPAERAIVRAVILAQMEACIFHKTRETHVDAPGGNAGAHRIGTHHFRCAIRPWPMSDGNRPGDDFR